MNSVNSPGPQPTSRNLLAGDSGLSLPKYFSSLRKAANRRCSTCRSAVYARYLSLTASTATAYLYGRTGADLVRRNVDAALREYRSQNVLERLLAAGALQDVGAAEQHLTEHIRELRGGVGERDLHFYAAPGALNQPARVETAAQSQRL